jgi:hypothetical protein
MNPAPASTKPWKKAWITFFIGCVFCAVFFVLGYLFDTPEHKQARQARQASYPEKRAEERARRKMFCESAPICKKYGAVRQECLLQAILKTASTSAWAMTELMPT